MAELTLTTRSSYKMHNEMHDEMHVLPRTTASSASLGVPCRVALLYLDFITSLCGFIMLLFRPRYYVSAETVVADALGEEKRHRKMLYEEEHRRLHAVDLRVLHVYCTGLGGRRRCGRKAAPSHEVGQ